jgi:hypothetical protein
VVSIAREVIEEFAGKITLREKTFADKITSRKETFEALRHIVCVYSKRDISRKAVQQALSRVRRDLKKRRPDLVRVEDSTSGP